MLTTIVSGGQTGVDRAALDAAVSHGLLTGGWAPNGWQTSDGPDLTLKRLGLQEHTGGYRERTIANVEDSDGTLVLAVAMGSPGTKLTVNEANRQLKPMMAVHLNDPDPRRVVSWLKRNGIEILNVAGNRETKSNGVYRLACLFLQEVLTQCKQQGETT
jgi:predicted Rossmann fold nucleotide-binding protein DprA/Smf involved in DNA uptake